MTEFRKDQGNTPTPQRVPEGGSRNYQRGKTHAECGWHHPWGWDSELNKKAEVGAVETAQSLRALALSKNPEFGS